MTDREAAALLMKHGHTPDGIEIVDRRDEFPDSIPKHRFYCSCGYVSTNRATMKDAISAGIHHMRTEAKKLDANGVSLPNSIAAHA